MIRKCKQIVQTYNNFVGRNSSSLFIILIYWILWYFLDFNVKEDILPGFFIMMTAIILGVLADFFIFYMNPKREKFDSYTRKSIAIAYGSIALIALLIYSVLLLVLCFLPFKITI